MKNIICLLILVFGVVCFNANADEIPEKISYDGMDYVYDSSSKEFEQKVVGDINGDGKDELIWSYRAVTDDGIAIPLCATLIYEINGDKRKLVKTITEGERPDKLYAADFDNDGTKELVVITGSGMHWTNVIVYQYKNSDYIKIFEDGTAASVVFEENARPLIIKVGRPKWDRQANWSYADEPLWEVYKWDDNASKFSKELSSSD